MTKISAVDTWSSKLGHCSLSKQRHRDHSIEIESKHALPGHCMHHIILRGFNIGLRPKAGVF